MFLSSEYLILLIALFVINIKPKRELIFCVMMFMFLLGLSRGVNVGTDHAGYELDFLRFRTLDTAKQYLNHPFEWGFLCCIWIFKSFSNDYAIFSSMLFIPFWIGILRFFKLYGGNVALSLLLFYLFGFYFFGYSAMRQVLAMALILLALPNLMKGEYVKFAIITFVVSILFHKSQLAYELLIPIHFYLYKKQIRISKKPLLVMLIVSYSLFFMEENVFVKIFMNTVVNLLGLSEYSAYIMGMNGQEVSSNSTSLLFTFLALVCVYFKKDCSQLRFLVFVFGVSLFNITSMMGAQSARISFCFLFFITVAIPEICQELNTKPRIFFKLTTILCGVAYFISAFVLNNVYGVNPYYNFF